MKIAQQIFLAPFMVLISTLVYAQQVTPIKAAIPSVDPLTAQINTADAERFAKLFNGTSGKPTAAQIQKEYLTGAGRGVEIFTPYRITDAATMAAAVAEKAADYRYAITTCLPLVASTQAELRAVYLAYRGLLPNRTLPTVYVVFGAGTSGGTANPDAQVLGLEVMCSVGTKPEQFIKNMRAIFAHETVHSWQSEPSKESLRNLLLLMALREGTPDYLAGLVTGVAPSAEREMWGRAREAELWKQFQADAAVIAARKQDDMSKEPEVEKAMQRWFYNYGKAPAGWPFEGGYWVGMQIAAAYVAQASDKRAAIEDLIAMRDPAAILKASGYEGGRGRALGK